MKGSEPAGETLEQAGPHSRPAPVPPARGGLLRRRLLNPLRTVLFLTLFLIFEAACSIYATLLIDIPGLLIPAYRRRFARRLWNSLIGFWGRFVCALGRVTVGFRIRVEGELPPGRHIVVSNHQSTVDILVLFDVFAGKNLKFVVKKELLRFIPNVSRALRSGGFGVVDFSNRVTTVEGLHRYAAGLEAWDGSPVIFPEGQRTFGGEVAPFKRFGIQLLVRETGLPVLPVVLDGLWHVRSFGRFLLHLPDTTCRVRILEPIRPQEHEIDGLAGRLEETIRGHLDSMRREAASR